MIGLLSIQADLLSALYDTKSQTGIGSPLKDTQIDIPSFLPLRLYGPLRTLKWGEIFRYDTGL